MLFIGASKNQKKDARVIRNRKKTTQENLTIQIEKKKPRKYKRKKEY